MTNSPLCISFLWHMHQPFYKDHNTNIYRLPWVRLHGTKDYLYMVDILSEFPEVKQNFNFSPSLLEQLVDYTENNAKDILLELSIKKASELDLKEKIFILENFFLANCETMIKPLPRYYELLLKRGFYYTENDLIISAKHFKTEDFLDLQVLFNLCWINSLLRNRDPFLKMLVAKGKGYSEEEKKELISKQLSILRKIIHLYKETALKGQIEVSVSPFYHPILPLLYDINIAKIALPDINLPKKHFSYPEDAKKQIKMAIHFFEKVFGFHPSGMWPSEGSVSEDVLKLILQEGIIWVGTDEDILSRSISKQLRDSSKNIIDPNILYRPYLFEGLNIIFRDHYLSDLIGFVYSKWDSKEAANDLIEKFLHIRALLPERDQYLVSIILDGENAWEYYHNNGIDFLRYLYEGLSREESLRTVTISEFLSECKKVEPLNNIFPGSWIYSNFGIWIGHSEDNTAWDYLKEARDTIEVYQKLNPDKDLSNAWNAIYIAEGSDWNWWYGDEHASYIQRDFDDLFRINLMKVYREIGKEVPDYLFVPIHQEDKVIQPSVNIKGFIYPVIDGTVTSYFEWYQAAYINTKKLGGSMHRVESILSGLYYGFNRYNLYLRIDPSIPFDNLEMGISFNIYFITPTDIKIFILPKPFIKAEFYEKIGETWEKKGNIHEIAIKDILEIAIKFHDLYVKEQDEIKMYIKIFKNSNELERFPMRGYISLIVPTKDFESLMWY